MKTLKSCKCGTENPDDAIYCRKCGIIIDYQTTKGNKKNSKKGCWWLVILIIAGIVGVFIAINSDNSTDYSYEQPETIEESVVETPIKKKPSTTYLTVSKDDIYFDADGGSIDININTDGDWEISVQPESWGHITQHKSYLTLRIDKNSNNSNRTDYLKVKAGSFEKKIEITQYANTEPSATIESVWTEHNVMVNGYMGMKIHIKFTTENMKDKTVNVYAYFYYSDNTTNLHDTYGNHLYLQSYGTPSYDSARFNDFVLFMPYFSLNMPPGWNGTLSFDISIKEEADNQLTRKMNIQFNLFSTGGW